MFTETIVYIIIFRNSVSFSELYVSLVCYVYSFFFRKNSYSVLYIFPFRSKHIVCSSVQIGV